LSFDECFAPRFDQLTTRGFLDQRGFSSRAITSFFAPFYGGILLDRSLGSSASVLLYTFKMLAEGRTVIPANGMGAIAAQLAASLPKGAIQLNRLASRIITSPSGVRGVTFGNGEEIAASCVVLAADPKTIGALAITAGTHVAVPDASLGCTTVYLASLAPLLEGDALWLNGAASGTVSHAVTISNVAPTYAPPGRSLTAATVLGASAVLDDAELVPRVRADLAAMGRIAECASAELLGVWRVPYSQYAQPPGSVARRVAATTSVPGLFVASELAHSSSLEGAARGGLAAADAVMRSVVRG
jgi:phytoene dehydrogenase-like protein